LLRKKQTLTYLAVMIAVVFWASSFPATRYSLGYYSPGSIMLLRFLIASATLVVIGAIKKIRLPHKRDFPLIGLSGFVGIFLYMFFFNTGTVHVASGVSGFVIATAPIFTLIMSRILLKEVVSVVCWVGVTVSFCGIVVIMFSQEVGFSLNIGVVILLLASISTSGYAIMLRKLFKTYTALEATTYAVVVATFFMLVFLPGFISELPGSTITVNMIIAYMGVFPAALAYLVWGYALSKAEKTAHVTVFLYLIPFLASLLAYLWLGETFSVWSFIGGVVIILGMMLTNLRGKSNASGVPSGLPRR